MVDISIAQGQGITQAIKTKIEASGQKISNNDLSIWQQVMTEVKTAQQTAQQNGSQIYSGGDDIAQLNNKNNWKTDFKVMGAQVIQIASDVWNKIVQLLTGKAPENLENNPDPVENQQKGSVTSNANQPQSPEVVEDEPPKGTVVGLNPDNLGISDIVSQPEILSGNMAKNEHPTGPNTPPPVYNETVNPGDLQQAQRVADPLAGQQEHGPVIYQGQEITPGEPKAKVVGLSIDNLSSIVQKPDVPEITVDLSGRKLSDDDINNNVISNLEPGKSFSYPTNNTDFGVQHVTWTRENDNTLTKTVVDNSLYDSAGKTLTLDLSTHYSPDGNTILSKEQQSNLSFAKSLISVRDYDENGNPGNILTTDLTNLDSKLANDRSIQSANFGPNVTVDSISRVLSSLDGQSNTFEVQEFKDTSGNSVVTFKDGKYYDAKGKEIDFDKAFDILNNLKEKNELASLTQIYKKESPRGEGDDHALWLINRNSAVFYKPETGLYTYRGFRSSSLSFAKSAAEYAAMDLSDNKNRYIKLSNQNPATLTEEDKAFMKEYKATLDKMQITINSEGLFANIEGCEFIH